MTTTEWVWLLVGAISLLLVGGALLGGVYLFVGDWRKSKARRGQQDYHPPEPSPSTPAPPLPGSERIKWGKVQDWEWIEVSPINSASETDDENVNCPICRQKIDEATGQVIKCPQCGNLYHQRCLAVIGHKCSNCGKEIP